MEELKKYEKMNVFDEEQLKQIKKGLEEGLDVSIYAKKEFDSYQMWQIRDGLNRNLDISIYADSKYNSQEMSCIRRTLNKKFNPKDLIGKVEFELLPLFAEINNLGLNVFDYIDRDEKSLKSVRTRTLNKKVKEILSSKGYNINDFNKDYIKVVKESVLDKIDLSPYISKDFNSNQLNEIKYGLEQGLDVSWYAKKEFNNKQMWEIILGLLNNLNVGLYAYPKFSSGQMKCIRESLKKGTFRRSDYFNSKIIDNKITYIPKGF